jgi:hypothetical protein
MSFTIIDCDQRTPEWKAARCGRVTGTCANAMLSEGRKKGEESYQRRDLRLRKVCELLTGIPQDDGYTNRWMEYGLERQDDALAAYEAATGLLVRRTGFLSHNELRIGCSLDGDVDDFTGIIELKAPKSFTHLTYLRDPRIPTDYYRQLLHNLFVSDAQWADFVSFDDRFPAELQLVVRRVQRADIDLKAYELALRLFLKEVEQEYDAVKALMNPRAA